MENKAEYKYLTIPHSLIQRIYTHPKTAIRDIIVVGIYKTSTYEKVNTDNALQQLMYCYYRKREDLTNELELLLESLVKSGGIVEDEDYNGFSGDNFHVEREDIEGLYYIIDNYLKKVYDYYSSSKYKRLTKMLEVMEVRKFFSRIPTKQRKTYISTTLNDLELAKAITIDCINKEVKEKSFRHRKNIISRNITRFTNEGVKKELDRNIQTMNTQISKELQ